jgi:hypothetical protein
MPENTVESGERGTMNTTQPVVMRLLAEQRKRCLATILNAAETSPWWPTLSEAQQNMYRDQVKTALAVFYDLTRDVVKVTEDDTNRNTLALDLIRAIHAGQQKITDHLGAGSGRG